MGNKSLDIKNMTLREKINQTIVVLMERGKSIDFTPGAAFFFGQIITEAEEGGLDEMREIVKDLVGGKQMRHVRAGDQLGRGDFVFADVVVTIVPDRLGILLVDLDLTAEELLQLDLRPVIKRVSEGRAEHAAVGEELFLIRCRFSRDILLVDTVVAHQAPLVMIAREPDLKNIRKGLVL